MIISEKVTVFGQIDVQEVPYATLTSIETTPMFVTSVDDDGYAIANSLAPKNKSHSEIKKIKDKYYKIPGEPSQTLATRITEKLPAWTLRHVRIILGEISGTVQTEACAFIMRHSETGEYKVIAPRYQVLTGAHYLVSAKAMEVIFKKYQGYELVGEFHSHPFGENARAFLSGEDYESSGKLRGRIYGNITFGKGSKKFGTPLIILPHVYQHGKYLSVDDVFEGGTTYETVGLIEGDPELYSKYESDITYIKERHQVSESVRAELYETKDEGFTFQNALRAIRALGRKLRGEPEGNTLFGDQETADTNVVHLTKKVGGKDYYSVLPSPVKNAEKVLHKFSVKDITAVLESELAMTGMGEEAFMNMAKRACDIVVNGVKMRILVYAVALHKGYVTGYDSSNDIVRDQVLTYVLPNNTLSKESMPDLIMVVDSMDGSVSWFLTDTTGKAVYRIDTKDVLKEGENSRKLFRQPIDASRCRAIADRVNRSIVEKVALERSKTSDKKPRRLTEVTKRNKPSGTLTRCAKPFWR